MFRSDFQGLDGARRGLEVSPMTSRDTPSSNEPYDVFGPAQFGTPRRLAPCAEGCFSSQAGLASFQPWPIEQTVSGTEGSDGHDVHAVPPAVRETPASDDDEASTTAGTIDIDGVGEFLQ